MAFIALQAQHHHSMARLGDFVGVSSVVCGSTNKSGILSASPRVLLGNFWWNLQLHLPTQVDFTPSFLAGNTPRFSSRLVVFPSPRWNSGKSSAYKMSFHVELETAYSIHIQPVPIVPLESPFCIASSLPSSI